MMKENNRTTFFGNEITKLHVLSLKLSKLQNYDDNNFRYYNFI